MGRSRIQLRHLLYFIKIVDAGSFSRAATLIHVAQPALSQQMSELEESLGVSVLHRSARGVQPTAAGKLLYAEAEAIIHRIEHLPDLVRAHSEEVNGVVRLGLSQVLAAFMTAAITGACRSALPNVTLHLVRDTSEQLAHRIREHSLDIALIFDGEFAAGVTSQPLFRQQLFLIAQRTALLEQESVTWDALRDMPLVLPAHPHEHIVQTLLDPIFNEGPHGVTILVENDFWAQISAVQAGLGFALLAIGDLSHTQGGAEMKAVPLEPPVYMTASHITSAAHPLTPAADATLNVINNLIARHLDEQKIIGAIRVVR
ncbi:LysR family transcriptional regulator [Paraburkholderia sp. DHOC27]|uniref:LysR family transcriptional regulator n=1 Tax=Paraburkholderia sp. DHOC27 TaxID=2303330 RepID=UPI0015F3259A|nr:LysR substrate-binding domain-containing protein [Paraburkholderia sp. DHOC27]